MSIRSLLSKATRATMIVALGCSTYLGMLTSSSSGQEIAESTPPARVTRVLEHLEILRPIVITNAGDGSNRLFIASQYGVIYVLPNGQSKAEPEVFMDLSSKVQYKDSENEEGFLGFAFHPKFKENGQFFVYYTTKDAPHTSVVSRFTAKPANGKSASIESEQELMRIPQPFWNHNGGTICFGPDGMLYIGLGDGGKANDPMENGQNLSTLLGSILRIDVDHHDQGKAYAIPKDNPFVGKEGALPEIYAYGVRNIWRMSFDRKTGLFYAADVGQDLWEEINVVSKGDNLGWNRREGKHPFGAKGVEANAEMVDPIYEYHHEVGKSITGGHVYRGKAIPGLDGVYLYGDYVSGKIWGIKYDPAKKQVTDHFTFGGVDQVAVITFGEDEAGEVYFSDAGGRIFSFAK